MFLAKSCKITLNYVNIDRKRSLSKLALGQNKFDLRSMSNTSKLRQVVHDSTRLDGTRVFILIYGLDQNANASKQTNAPFEKKKFFLIYSEKLMTTFFTCNFSELYTP